MEANVHYSRTRERKLKIKKIFQAKQSFYINPRHYTDYQIDLRDYVHGCSHILFIYNIFNNNRNFENIAISFPQMHLILLLFD